MTAVRPGGCRQALRVREFTGVLGAFAISLLGDSAAYLAVTVLVFQRTGSPLLASLVFAVAFAPYLIGGTLLSSLVDRLRPRSLLAGFDLVAGALVCLLLLPAAGIPVLFGVLLAIGVLAPIRAGASAALVADVLPADAYVAGRSALRICAQLGQIAGIAFGGGLIAVLGPRLALTADAGSFLVSAAIIAATVHNRPARTTVRESLVGGSLRRIRAVWAQRPIRTLLLADWLLAFVAVAPEGLAAPAVAQAGASPATVGLWLGALPIGMVVGDLAAIWLIPVHRRTALLLPLGCARALLLASFALNPPRPISLALLVTLGLTAAYGLGLDQRLRSTTPPPLLSQTLAVRSTGMMAIQGIGFATAGALGELLTAHQAIAITGALAVAALALLRPGLADDRRHHGSAVRSRPSHNRKTLGERRQPRARR